MIRISIFLTFICLFAAKSFAVTDLKVTNDNCEYKKPAVVYFATHAIAHPFWTIVENGAMEGARDACITLKWTEDVNFSVQTTIERRKWYESVGGIFSRFFLSPAPAGRFSS